MGGQKGDTNSIATFAIRRRPQFHSISSNARGFYFRAFSEISLPSNSSMHRDPSSSRLLVCVHLSKVVDICAEDFIECRQRERESEFGLFVPRPFSVIINSNNQPNSSALRGNLFHHPTLPLGLRLVRRLSLALSPSLLSMLCLRLSNDAAVMCCGASKCLSNLHS